MDNILLTGCAGFIGSNFISYFIKKYNNYNLINLDNLTYAGSKQNISEVDSNSRHKFIKGDICNRALLEKIFKENNITGVINFAAESHVDNSIRESNLFIKTNILGTHLLVDVAYKYWMSGPFQYKKKFLNSRFLQISTDEVYGSIGGDDLFTEKSPYSPNSPYSASKASSDMIIRSYNKTYGMNTLITCSSNNYGPKQHDEKFIPTIIRKVVNLQSIPVYGDGKNVRDWMYVLDHCEAIDLVFHNGKSGETYNIGGNFQLTNLEVVNIICTHLNNLAPSKINYLSLVKHVKDRPGHDRRYAIDATKIKKELGWSCKINYVDGFLSTLKWYLKKNER